MAKAKRPLLIEGWHLRLKEVRLLAGASQRPATVITQQAVGEAVGITGAAYGRYEKGLKQPQTFELLEGVCRYLNANPAYVLFQLGDPFPYPKPGDYATKRPGDGWTRAVPQLLG